MHRFYVLTCHMFSWGIKYLTVTCIFKKVNDQLKQPRWRVVVKVTRLLSFLCIPHSPSNCGFVLNAPIDIYSYHYVNILFQDRNMTATIQRNKYNAINTYFTGVISFRLIPLYLWRLYIYYFFFLKKWNFFSLLKIWWNYRLSFWKRAIS